MKSHARSVQAVPRAYGERFGYEPVARPPRVRGETVREDWLPAPTPETLRDRARRMQRVTPERWRRHLGMLMRKGADLSRPEALDAAWTAYICRALGVFHQKAQCRHAPAHAADLLSPRALDALRVLCNEPEPEDEPEVGAEP